MIKTDFHMHSTASFDGHQTMEQLCERAIAVGLTAVAITEHAEMIGCYKPSQEQLNDIFGQMTAIQECYAGRLRVARGIELGQPMYALESAETALSSNPYDVVLASQHMIGDGLDYYCYQYDGVDDDGLTAIMQAYFSEVLRMTEWGKFHVLAHLTYPFRYLPERLRVNDYSRWFPVIDQIYDRLIADGKALEINVAGLRNANVGVAAPDLSLVRHFRERGGQYVTIGSDAHRQEDVGVPIEEGLAIARDAGFDAVTVFFDGKPELVKI